MIYNILSSLANLFCKILFRYQIKGKENIPRNGGFILASNHSSYLDPILLGGVCPRKLNFMAKHDLFSNPSFSWLLNKVGAFPVKRGSADLSSIKEAMQRVRDGGGLLVFPEGRRMSGPMHSNPEGVDPPNTFKEGSKPEPGVGFLAAKLNVPVIPVFLKGTAYILPRGAKFIRPKRIFVYFGKEISIERRLPYQDIADEIMRSIRQLSC